MDVFTPQERSRIMGRVRARDTSPELIVRRLLHRLGFRFRLHRSDLPGKPDITLAKHSMVIFVHGCYWHGHDCRAGQNRPSSNQLYWSRKLDRNMERDVRNIAALTTSGWRCMVIWECETKNMASLEQKLQDLLAGQRTAKK